MPGVMVAAKACLLAALFLDASAVRARKGRKKASASARASAVATTAPNDAPKKYVDAIAPVDSPASASASEPGSAPPQEFVGPAPPTVAQGEAGVVDYILTLGAPGSASPGLQNQRGSNSCFEGLRIYQSDSSTWPAPDYVDPVAEIGNWVYLYHPWYPSMNIDVDGYDHYDQPCNLEETWQPSLWFAPYHPLHYATTYVDSIEKVLNDDYFSNISSFAGLESYIHDPDEARKSVESMGWGLVGTAYHPGGWFQREQVTHLIQHPDTNECVLTFQGTASIQGGLIDIDFYPAKFCGLVDEDEECAVDEYGVPDGECQVRGKGSFVHEGFRDTLLAILQTSDFQKFIRPNLGSCSRVVTAGHSLGGGVSELFAACASKAPQPGQFGYDDYKHMSWTKGAATKLQYVH